MCMLAGMARRSAAARLRAREQSARIGQEVKRARVNLGQTRQQLASRAGVSWATELRVELGEPGIRLDTMCAVAEAAGLDVVLRAYPGKQPSLRDTGQLEQVEWLIAQADRYWVPEIELAVGPHGEAIDAVFFATTEIHAYEVERTVGDWQDQNRRADGKRQMLAAQHGRPVRLVVAIEDTVRNRNVLAPHASVIRAALPAGSREVFASLRSGQPLGRDGLLWVRRRRVRRPVAQSIEARAPERPTGRDSVSQVRAAALEARPEA